MGHMPPRAETRRRRAAGLRQRALGALCATVLAGCGAGLSSASEAADRGATEASTTRAESSPDGSTRTSEDPAAADRSTEDGVDDEAALGIGDDYFPDSGNPGYDVASYDLVLDMDDDLVGFEAVATIALRTTEDLDELRFDLDGLTVTTATIDGKKVEQRRAGLDLVLTPEAPLPADEPVVVIVDYEGMPEPRGSDTLGELGWIGEPGVGSYVASEPDGASNWWPTAPGPEWRPRAVAPPGRGRPAIRWPPTWPRWRSGSTRSSRAPPPVASRC